MYLVQAGARHVPFPHCILGTPAYLTHSPQHCHWVPQALCCLYPLSSQRCWPDYSTSASSETASSPRARAGWGCGGAGLAAAGRQRATGSSRSPARGRRPGTCGRPCSSVSKRVVDVHEPGYAAAGVGLAGTVTTALARRCGAGILQGCPPASWERTRTKFRDCAWTTNSRCHHSNIAMLRVGGL